MTFTTCLDEIAPYAHFTWTQWLCWSLSIQRVCHCHTSCVVCSASLRNTVMQLRKHFKPLFLGGVTEIASVCASQCKSYRLLCDIHQQIYLFTDHRLHLLYWSVTAPSIKSRLHNERLLLMSLTLSQNINISLVAPQLSGESLINTLWQWNTHAHTHSNTPIHTHYTL